ncbi:MAG: hypothetical protein IJM83_12325, partial [Firmicutes bacterium]|nr:hypothetical protein [Bacillota bacterium]
LSFPIPGQDSLSSEYLIQKSQEILGGETRKKAKHPKSFQESPFTGFSSDIYQVLLCSDFEN